jgi:hypothetical protein
MILPDESLVEKIRISCGNFLVVVNGNVYGRNNCNLVNSELSIDQSCYNESGEEPSL